MVLTECTGPSKCKNSRDLEFSQSEHTLEVHRIGVHLEDLDHFEINWIFEEDNDRVDCLFDVQDGNQGKSPKYSCSD